MQVNVVKCDHDRILSENERLVVKIADLQSRITPNQVQP